MVVDVFGVGACQRRIWKKPGEDVGAGVAEFVERHARTRTFGEDGELAGAGGGLQNNVLSLQGRRLADQERKLHGRRELLELDSLLGAAGVRREQACGFVEEGEDGGGRTSFADGGEIFPEKQHLRGFQRVIGRLPNPLAVRVGTAKRQGECRTQGCGVEHPAA